MKTLAQKVMAIANEKGLTMIEQILTSHMDNETALKFLNFNRWHYKKFFDGSKFKIRVMNGRVDTLEVYE
jgi:hypothetical protein